VIMVPGILDFSIGGPAKTVAKDPQRSEERHGSQIGARSRARVRRSRRRQVPTVRL
jgi:hypothetical protein